MTKIYPCFRCNKPIEFTSKVTETPSGSPTKDPLTQKPKPLDPLTKEYHVCREEDVAAYKTTPEYQKRVAEWKANRGSLNVGNTGNTTHNNITLEQQQQSYTPSKNEDLFFQGKIERDLDYLKKSMLEVKKTLKIPLSQEEGDI
jgi:hypothetical protein